MKDLNLEIDSQYSTFSLSIVLHLIHNNEEYKELWSKKYPNTAPFANNFFKNSNCGCRPNLVNQYKRDRFNADIMTVNFINTHEDPFKKKNPKEGEEDEKLDLKGFCDKVGSQELNGFVFAIPASEGHYKDFLASIQQKNAEFSHFNTLQLNDKIILTFF